MRSATTRKRSSAADDHAGLRAAIREVLAEAAYQRCHFLRNALDHLPRKHADGCLQELRWRYDRRDLAEATADLARWLAKWQGKYPRLTAWAEDTFTDFSPPMPHHKHMKSTNMLERLNEGVRRRTYVVRIFLNTESCRRLVRALAVETHENWMEASRYLNMDDLREHKKLALKQAVITPPSTAHFAEIDAHNPAPSRLPPPAIQPANPLRPTYRPRTQSEGELAVGQRNQQTVPPVPLEEPGNLPVDPFRARSGRPDTSRRRSGPRQPEPR